MSNTLNPPGYSYRGFVTSKWREILKKERDGIKSQWCVAVAGDAVHVWLTEPFKRVCRTLKNLCNEAVAVSQPDAHQALCNAADRFDRLMTDGMLPFHLKLLEEFESGNVVTTSDQAIAFVREWVGEIGDLVGVFETLSGLPEQDQVIAEMILEYELKVLHEDMSEVLSLIKEINLKVSAG